MALNATAISAAGGVVLRTDDVLGPLILVVHRPRYDDWGLPKGKRDPEETDAQCALREVHEETGLRCAVGPEITEITYRDHKVEFSANEEVNETRWVTPDEAGELLSYARDADIVRSALRQLR